MDKDKRKLNYSQSSEQITKKSRSKIPLLSFSIDVIDQSITSMENLSNELFYEMFDYLDSCDIYQAFSKLNYRFQRLLNSSSLLFKTTFDQSTSEQKFIKTYKQMIRFNKNQILSIHLLSSTHKKMISSLNIDSSFTRLESLIFHSIKPNILISLLPKLTPLPRLFSLTINTRNILKDLTDIYRFIFQLPKLQYIRFFAMASKATVSLPFCIHKQISTIKHLIMNHSIALHKFFSILSYTSQIDHLSFTQKRYSTLKAELISPILLTNLTHLSIHGTDLTFDTFEIFITKICSKLKFLSLKNLAEDMNYLNDDRWEKFILKYLSQLEKFYLKYLFLPKRHSSKKHIGKSNLFNSSFWIERQWIFEIEIRFDSIIYSIHPYKKRWFEYDSQYNMMNSSKFMQIVFTIIPYSEKCYSLEHILPGVEIYHLKIHEELSMIALIEILNFLPHLDSLQISSLIYLDPIYMINEEREILSLIIRQNQITKVYLRKMIHIDDVYFLMELCPRMKYLKVDFSNHMDIEVIIPLIFMKISNKYNHQLRLLCFRIAAADEKFIEKLNEMMKFEKFLFDYKINRVLDNIYIQWK